MAVSVNINSNLGSAAADPACAESTAVLSKTPLRVCHIASGDRWAGAEIQIATLGRALAARSDMRLCAVVLNEGRLVQELRAAGIEVLVVPENRLGFLEIFAKSCTFLRGRQIDVLHSHRYKENLLAAMLRRKLAVPFAVRTEHGLAEPFHGWKHIKLNSILALDRMVGRHSVNRVIAVTDDIRNRLRQYFPAEKICVVNNAVDLRRLTSKLSSEEAKHRLGIAPESAVVGTVARLEPIKRLDLFVQICNFVHQVHPKTTFVVAGDGSQRKSTQALVRALNLTSCFHMLGERSDIADVLRAMDLFVLCSDHEGLPTALLEALYVGVPVVARAVGGIPEVIGNSQTAELVTSDDPAVLAAACLRALFGDSSAWRERARRRVEEHFSVDKMAERTAQLYLSLAGAR
jgi:glycosyltransferase involved in cell wall biosynthesis